MKLTDLSIITLLMTNMLSGCGGSSSSESESIQTLKGAWQINCTADEGGESFDANIIYQEESFVYSFSQYSGGDCQNNKYRVQIEGNYELGDELELNSGNIALKLSQDVASYQIAYYGTSAISQLNNDQQCDHSNWSSGELQEISDCEYFEIDLESFKKDIVKIENSQLIFGDFDFIGENGYPTQFEEEVFTFQSATALEGKWLQRCWAEDQTGYRRSLEFIGNTAFIERSSYSDTSCEVKVVTRKSTYLFTFGANRILASGETVSELNLKLFSDNLAFYGVSIIDEVNLNEDLICGMTSWKNAVYKDVFNCDWTLSAAAGELKNIAKLDGAELTFGDNEFVGEDGFATQLQAESYIRQ
jgi:hypothetical protein